MNPIQTLRTGVAAALLTTAITANAGENLWLYTQGVDTRPQGSWELKLANMSRIGKNSGDYVFHDLRPEIEYGITDRFTMGIEALIFRHDYRNVEWAPMVETQGGPGGSFHKTQLGGFEVASKYMVLSPYKDPIGLSLGLSFEYRDAYRLDGGGIEQTSWVPTLYLQKNWLDDTLSLAFKGKMELERRTSPGVLEEEIAFDLAAGISYRFAPRWNIGFEARWQSDFLSPEVDGNPPEGKPSSWDWGGWQLGDQFQHGLYVGPSIHYASERWWATLGALYQVRGWSADGAAAASQGRNWDEHERWHVGLILGWEFGGNDDLPDVNFAEGGSFK